MAQRSARLGRRLRPRRHPKVHVRELDRTFASWLAEDGVHMFTVARLLGRSSKRTIEQLYARVSQEHLPGALSDLVATDANREVRRQCVVN